MENCLTKIIVSPEMKIDYIEIVQLMVKLKDILIKNYASILGSYFPYIGRVVREQNSFLKPCRNLG